MHSKYFKDYLIEPYSIILIHKSWVQAHQRFHSWDNSSHLLIQPLLTSRLSNGTRLWRGSYVRHSTKKFWHSDSLKQITGRFCRVTIMGDWLTSLFTTHSMGKGDIKLIVTSKMATGWHGIIKISEPNTLMRFKWSRYTNTISPSFCKKTQHPTKYLSPKIFQETKLMNLWRNCMLHYWVHDRLINK